MKGDLSEVTQREDICLECPYRSDFGHFMFGNHVREKHAGQRCICLLCKSNCKSIPALIRHIKRNHLDKWKLIGKRSKYIRTYSIKMKYSNEDIENKQGTLLKNILYTKSESGLLKCNQCGCQSESKSKLQSHACSGNNDLICKECGFLAGSTITWKRHNRFSHGDKKKIGFL